MSTRIPPCPKCGGKVNYRGSMANILYFRCRSSECGIEFIVKTQKRVFLRNNLGPEHITLDKNASGMSETKIVDAVKE
jgi:tRNA(Ile2) C34 agmatinyltransferase TiaS